MIDNMTSLAFSVYENKKVFALLIGSGVSRAAQIPTGWEVTLDLVRRLAILQGESEQVEWGAWYKEKYGKTPDYSELLDLVSSTPDERRSIIHSYIEPNEEEISEGKKSPTKAHHAIARLVKGGVVRVIITTNFDRLIENALREIGVEPTVIKSDDDLSGAVPLIHSNCCIVKIHGDYLDTRIRNINDELTEYSAAMDAMLDRVLDEHGLIVCGWSGEWDHALRRAISRAPNRRYPLYWAFRGTLHPFAEDIVGHRQGKVVPIADAESFFEKLEELVSVQLEMSRPDPRSGMLLVGRVKKYLSKPEFKIKLHDLIKEETELLLVSLQDNGTGVVGHGLDGLSARMVSQYELVSNSMLRMLGVLGRWGTGGEFECALEVIAQFEQLETRNGNLTLIKLKKYPAVLMFYVYGISLLRANKYHELYRMFMYPIARYGNKAFFVDSLFGDRWCRIDREEWKNILKINSHIPISEHLYELIASLPSDYYMFAQDLSIVFDEFELLAALVYLTKKYSEYEIAVMFDSTGRVKKSHGVPMGRSVCDFYAVQSVVDKWSGELLRGVIVSEFLHGNSELFDLAIKFFPGNEFPCG